MKKVINYRPLFWAFVSLLIGGLVSPIIIYGSLFIKICFPFVLVIFLLCAVFVPKIKNFKNAIFLCLICVIVVFGFNFIKLKNYENNMINTGLIEYSCYATDSITETGEIIVRDVKVDGKKLSGKMKLIIDDIENGKIIVGSFLKIKGSIRSIALTSENGDINSYVASQKIYYQSTVKFSNIEVGDAAPTIFERIRVAVREKFINNMQNRDIAEISYSVIFGDVNHISGNDYENYRLSGVIHLLSVSGLHVALIAAIIGFILKLLNAGQKTKFFVINFFILLFCFICGFSPPVARSGLMIFIYLLGKFLGEETDDLNTLCFSGIFIILLNPLSMFNAGFMLSFACVFGIFCLNKPVFRTINKLPLNEKLASLLSVSIAVFIPTTFITAFYFNSVPFISVLANIIIVPIFSVYFIMLLIVAAISFIISPISQILILPEIAYGFCKYFINLFAKFNASFINANLFLIVLAFIITFLAGHFVVLRGKIKSVLVCILTVVIVIVTIFLNVPVFKKHDSVFISQNLSVVLAAENSDAVAVVFSLSDEIVKDAILLSKKNRVKNLSAFILVGDQVDEYLVFKFINNYSYDLIINSQKNLEFNEEAKEAGAYLLPIGQSFMYKNYEVSSLYFGSDYVCSLISFNEVDAAFAGNINIYNDIEKIDAVLPDKCDLAIIDSRIYFDEFKLSSEIIVLKSFSGSSNSKIYDAAFIDFAFIKENNVLELV